MKRILIVEDDSRIAAALEVRFQSCGYAVVIANDAIQAARFAMNTRPDLLILDVSLPAGNGMMLAEKFQSIEAMQGIPFIFITGSREPRVRQQALELNPAGFFEKPYDIEELLAVVRQTLVPSGTRENRPVVSRLTGDRGAGKSSRNILIIEDDVRLAAALTLRLQDAGYTTQTAFDALLELQNAVHNQPDLVVLDISMPAGDGFEVAERIQKILPKPPAMIFLTASKRPVFRQRAQALGAIAYFEKPYEVEDLLKVIDQTFGLQPTPAQSP